MTVSTRRRWGVRGEVRGGAVGLVLGLVLALGAGTAQSAPPIPAITDEQGIPSLAPVLERVQPAVVSISVRGSVARAQNPLFSDPFFRRFFGMPDDAPDRQYQSAGSGVVVDAAEGLILTNHHVVDQADEITVTLMSGHTLSGEVVGSDPRADVAVLRVEGEELVGIEIGDSDDLRVGDFVVAIGNPFGLNQTVTSGIVSALGRSGLDIEDYEDFIQTDAAINPGNSGGALIDMRGQLIGINTAITSPGRGGNVGIGFAIPVNMATAIMKQLVAYGEVRRGQLGVLIQNLDPQLARGLGVDEQRGALVTEVQPGSAAEEAGIVRDDVIVGLNGRNIESASQLRSQIGLIEVGQEISLEILRDGRRRTIEAEIGEAGGERREARGRGRDRERAPRDELHPRLAGARFAEASALRESGERGVEVAEVEPGTAAFNLGLRPGDVIVEANRRKVESVADLEDAVKDDEEVLLLIERRGGALYLYSE